MVQEGGGFATFYFYYMLRMEGCDHTSSMSKAGSGHGLSALTAIPRMSLSDEDVVAYVWTFRSSSDYKGMYLP